MSYIHLKTVLINTAFCLSFLIGTNTLTGQNYSTALGFRGGGDEIGITLQQRITQRTTFEPIITFTTQHVTLNGLFEFHQPILTNGFNFYVGGGPHIGRLFDERLTYYGLTGIAGLEWKISIIPIVISADIHPEFHLEHPKNTELKYGISVRYVIVSKNAKQKKARKKEKEKVRKKEPEKTAPKTKYRIKNWWERNFIKDKKQYKEKQKEKKKKKKRKRKKKKKK